MNLELEIARVLSAHGASWSGSNNSVPSRPPVRGRELTYDDVRDERIEVAAQHALVRLSRKTPAERQAAIEMWAAIKRGRLAAIYQENQRLPALRARADRRSWWEIVPAGKDATFQKDPYGVEPPILVFRAVAANDPDKGRLGRALVAEWRQGPSKPSPSPCEKSAPRQERELQCPGASNDKSSWLILSCEWTWFRNTGKCDIVVAQMDAEGYFPQLDILAPDEEREIHPGKGCKSFVVSCHPGCKGPGRVKWGEPCVS